MRLIITDPLSPVIHLGALSIHWYGVGYAVAFLVGGRLAARHLAGRGISRQVTERITFWAIVAGLLGARLYFVAQNDPLWYLSHPQHILAVWEGGMAFFGAVFAALAVLLVASWKLRLDLWVLLDAAALFAAAGQPIGRIGNVMNGEILGPVSSLPWAIRYTNPETMAPHLGVAYQPANVYEGVATLCILAVLLLLRRRGVAPGVLGLAYLVLYPVSQLVVFVWRTDAETPVLLLGLKQAQLTSLFVLVVVVPAFLLVWWRMRRPATGRGQPPAGSSPAAVRS